MTENQTMSHTHTRPGCPCPIHRLPIDTRIDQLELGEAGDGAAIAIGPAPDWLTADLDRDYSQHHNVDRELFADFGTALIYAGLRLAGAAITEASYIAHAMAEGVISR